MVQRNLDIVMYSMKMDKDLFFRLVKDRENIIVELWPLEYGFYNLWKNKRK